MAVFPNPVTDGNIRLQLTNMPTGDYAVLLTNTEGQTIHLGTIHLSKEATITTVRPAVDLGDSYYHLEVSGPGGNRQMVPVLVQRNG